MEKINVLHVINSLEVGGAERLVVDIINETKPDSFNVSVCCLDKAGMLAEEVSAKGRSVTVLGRRPGIDWKLVSRLRALINEQKTDVIHAHQYTPFFYSSLAKHFCRSPRLIFTEHGRFYPDEKKMKRVLLDPLLSLTAGDIVAISEATKEAMVKYDNFPRNRIKVIYNGVKLQSNGANRFQKREELNISPDEFVLATAARLDPIKNHDMMIRMMEKVLRSGPDIKLLIAGDGAEYGRLADEIKTRGLDGSVRMMGYRADVKEIFQAADAFLLSSVSEGTSITLLEAMHAGLPAVVTNVGGNPEIVQGGISGFLVESDDDQAMAEKVLELYENADMRKKLAEAGMKRARELFSFEKMMERYEELYLKCAG